MPVQYQYRGRVITPDDIVFLRQFIAANSGLSRRKLSARVCEAWDWKQANGALRDMVCRGLLLMLHRAGEIELPAIRFVARNPLVERRPPAPMLIDRTPVIARLEQLRPVEVQQVRRTGDESLFNSLIEHHHYLGYEQPVGEHLKYIIWSQQRPIACLACSRRRGIWAAGTSSSVGTRKRESAISGFLLTTRAFLFCRGFSVRIWRRTFSAV